MELLEEFGIHGADLMIFLAVQEKLSYKLASEATGLAEGRVRHRFFGVCERLQMDPRGRALVEPLLARLIPPPEPSSPQRD